MISWEELKKHYDQFQGQKNNILKEYLQYKILDIIFKQDISFKLSFLGGTAIKICYGSYRFSEDLDFDNLDLKPEEFENLAEKIRKELSLLGYEVKIKNIFKGAFRYYIKIPQLLFDKDLTPHKNQKLIIQVDTASHGFSYAPENHLLQKFDVFTNIKVTPLDILLSQKAETILDRKRAKGRDFYDLVYLRGIADFNWEYLDHKKGISSKKELKEKILSRIDKLNLEDLARDVEPFLLNPEEDKKRVLHFRQFIEQKL